MTYQGSCIHSNRALTLIETLGALILLTMILSAAALVGMHTSKQWVHASSKNIAVNHADELLTDWWSSPKDIPQNQQGDIPDAPGWRWMTKTLPTPELEKVGLIRLQLSILEIPPDEVEVERTRMTILVPVAKTMDQGGDS